LKKNVDATGKMGFNGQTMNATLRIDIGSKKFFVPAEVDVDKDIESGELIYSINEADLSEISQVDREAINKQINSNKFEVLAE
jgi:hypothetical protein